MRRARADRPPPTAGISTFKGQDRALRADRLGTGGLLLSVLAATAPLMVVAGVMPTTFAVMGIVGQPLLFVILGVVLVLFSVGYAEMSRHVHNAGAFYAYISRGLGGTAGAGAAAGRARRLQRRCRSASTASSASRCPASSPPTSTSARLVDTGVGGRARRSARSRWLKIDVNARVLGVLLVVEVALVVIFDIAAVADPAKEGLSLHAFNPDTLTGAGRRHRAVLLHRRLHRLRAGPRVRGGDQPAAHPGAARDVPRGRLRRRLLRDQLLGAHRRRGTLRDRRRDRAEAERRDCCSSSPRAARRHVHGRRCTSSS